MSWTSISGYNTFDENITYYKGSLVLVQKDSLPPMLYVCMVDNTQGTWSTISTNFQYIYSYGTAIPQVFSWNATTAYSLGTIIWYNSKLLVCTTAQPATLTAFDSSYWTEITVGGSSGNGGDGILVWTAATEYKENQVVLYNSALYLCISAHTSSDTFEEDKWKVLTGSQGEKGEAGKDGYTPTIKTEEIDNGYSIEITNETESNTITIKNGADGNDGISPTIQVTTITTDNGGYDLTINDINGTQPTVGLRNGSNGASAYQIAVNNGFSGTEEEWLKSLKGEDGTVTVSTNKIDKTFVLSASDWSNNIPYTQTVTVNGITEDLNPRMDVVISENVVLGMKEEENFGYITRATTGTNSITAYCYETKPSIDLNVIIEVV